MGLFNIHSKREKKKSAKKIEVFEYDSIPRELRTQIVHILQDVIGNPRADWSPAGQLYRDIHDSLAREYGTFKLAEGMSHIEVLFNFILQTPDAKKVLDAIEISFARAITYIRQGNDYQALALCKLGIPEAIGELNHRFLEAGVGYQFEQGEMIRLDSHFAHAEIIKPALVLLSDSRFHGAQEEFLRAHKHYQEGNYKECLIECLKAFESTMKVICDIKKWSYNRTDTASGLIDVLFSNGLVPSIFQTQFNNLKGLLTSGVPTARNKLGAHGQGAVPTSVAPYIAAYALHMTAANIVFVVKAAGF